MKSGMEVISDAGELEAELLCVDDPMQKNGKRVSFLFAPVANRVLLAVAQGKEALFLLSGTWAATPSGR
jgi:hypothetical protein